MYVSHNYQFLAYSAATEGREAETLDAVRRSRASVSDAQLQEMPGTDWYVAELYTAPVRFGRWDMLLAEAPPAPGSASLTGGYLYATSVALAAKNRPADARERLAQLDKLIVGLPADVPAGQTRCATCSRSPVELPPRASVLPRRSFAQRGGRPRFPSARQRSEAANLPFVTGCFGR